VPRRPREEATRLVGQKGFTKSGDSLIGEVWRNPQTGDRVLIPNGTISEKNFRQIMHDVGYTTAEVETIVKGTKRAVSVPLGSTLVPGQKPKK
jgi:hypothetical protein